LPPWLSTLSLHDALPICFAHFRPGSRAASSSASRPLGMSKATISSATDQLTGDALRHMWIRERRGSDGHERSSGGEVLAGVGGRSEEHTSELQSRVDLVC